MFLHILTLFACTFTQSVLAISGECVSFKNHAKNEKFEIVYDWNYINFTWPSVERYETALNSGKYVPEENAIVGVKFYEDKLYLALPKAKPGAPVTLAVVAQYAENGDVSNPLLTPYPNWNMNLNSSCKALQDVQSMEIDRKGLMWVLDGRRMGKNPNNCPPKIILLDLKAGGRTIKSYNVPNSVCKHDSCFLNDLVVDDFDGGYAYITDTSSDPGIIVYSRKLNKSWKVRDKSMYAQKEALNFTCHGYKHTKLTPIDGITMAPPQTLDDPERMVYYTALTGFNLYGINSKVLRNEKLATSAKVSTKIRDFGPKIGPSDGLLMDSEGDIYFGILNQDLVQRWNVNSDLSKAESIDQNTEQLIWPDSFGMDPFGNLYLVTNNIGQFFEGSISKKDVNFRVMKLYTGTCSYLY